MAHMHVLDIARKSHGAFGAWVQSVTVERFPGGKCCALKLLPLDKQLLLNKCVLMQMVVHGKAQQYLKDLMIPSERIHFFLTDAVFVYILL